MKTKEPIFRNYNARAIEDALVAIYKLPVSEGEACLELADHIRRACKVAGEPVGTLALALISAEAKEAEAATGANSRSARHRGA